MHGGMWGVGEWMSFILFTKGLLGSWKAGAVGEAIRRMTTSVDRQHGNERLCIIPRQQSEELGRSR